MNERSPEIPRMRWDRVIHRGLTDMIAAHGSASDAYDPRRPPVAALDWDDTCIRGDISLTLLEDLSRERSRDLIAEYEADCRRDTRSGYTRLVSTLVAGLTAEQVEERGRQTLARGLDDGRIAWREEMREVIAALHRTGWQVWVVTGAAVQLVRAIAPLLGVAPDRVVGMRSAAVDGVLTGDVLEPVPYREGKVRALALHTSDRLVFAAGDADADVPLLEAAEHALVVDAGDRSLRRRAQQSGWWLQTGWGRA